jgi:hypothetical protein
MNRLTKNQKKRFSHKMNKKIKPIPNNQVRCEYCKNKPLILKSLMEKHLLRKHMNRLIKSDEEVIPYQASEKQQLKEGDEPIIKNKEQNNTCVTPSNPYKSSLIKNLSVVKNGEQNNICVASPINDDKIFDQENNDQICTHCTASIESDEDGYGELVFSLF